jgi:hypothetical protein
VLKADAAAGAKIQATRWFKATRNGATHTPSREEMREYYEAERGLIETSNSPNVRGVGDRKMFDPEFWRVSRRRTAAACELK